MNEDFLEYCERTESEIPSYEEDEYAYDDGDENEYEDNEDDEDEMVLKREIAVLFKRNIVSTLSLEYGASGVDGGSIVRVDPREEEPVVCVYQTSESARHFFEASIKTSVKNGWKVAPLGEPNFG